MNLEIIIREAGEQDFPFLATLSGELGYETTPEEAKERLALLVQDPTHVVYVAADHKGQILGWIHVYSTLRLVGDPSAELGGFVVSEAFRNQGIGKKLMTQAERWAQDNNARRFIIRTRSTRLDAHQFYEKSGYEFWKDHKVYRKYL
jgi:GNAT superfamily N-acetyltransferase